MLETNQGCAFPLFPVTPAEHVGVLGPGAHGNQVDCTGASAESSLHMNSPTCLVQALNQPEDSWVCRHAYVEQQMEKRLGVKKGGDKQQGPLDPEQALFVTPEELKARPMHPPAAPLPVLSSPCHLSCNVICGNVVLDVCIWTAVLASVAQFGGGWCAGSVRCAGSAVQVTPYEFMADRCGCTSSMIKH